MNEAQKTLLERAVKMLNACGAMYAIKMDSVVHIIRKIVKFNLKELTTLTLN